jgi:hypothetical protein
MTTTRTHFPFRIDVWTTNGESIVEKVVGWDRVQPAKISRTKNPEGPIWKRQRRVHDRLRHSP